MIRDEGSYELESLLFLCVSHTYCPADAISSAEPWGFCTYSVSPSSQVA